MTSRRAQLGAAVGALLVVAGALSLARSTVGYQQQAPFWRVALPVLAAYALVVLGYALLLQRTARATAVPGVRSAALPAAGRADWLLGLRGLAAALVLGMHGQGLLKHDVTWGGSSYAWLTYSPAWLGMLLFFGLSGYLMGKGFYAGRYTVSPSGLRRYFTSRFLRIVPLAAFVALMVVLLQVPAWLVRSDLVVRLSTFTTSSVQVPGVLVPLWSLSTEWQFYLLVPVLFLLATLVVRGAVGVALASAVVVGVGLLVRVAVWRTHGNSLAAYQYVYQPVYSNLEVFLLGMLTSWWRPVLRRAEPVLARAWPLLLAVVVLGYSWVAYRAMQQQDVTYQAGFALLLPTVVAVLLVPVLCGAEALSARAAVPTSPGARSVAHGLHWAGALTYPVYLVHVPVLFGVQAGMPEQPLWVRAGVGLLLVLLVATVLHVTVERTALDWRRGRMRIPVPEAASGPAASPGGPVLRPRAPLVRQ